MFKMSHKCWQFMLILKILHNPTHCRAALYLHNSLRLPEPRSCRARAGSGQLSVIRVSPPIGGRAGRGWPIAAEDAQWLLGAEQVSQCGLRRERDWPGLLQWSLAAADIRGWSVGTITSSPPPSPVSPWTASSRRRWSSQSGYRTRSTSGAWPPSRASARAWPWATSGWRCTSSSWSPSSSASSSRSSMSTTRPRSLFSIAAARRSLTSFWRRLQSWHSRMFRPGSGGTQGICRQLFR